MIEFTITGVDALAARLGVDLTPALRAATFAVGEQLRGKIAKYPGASRQPVQWSSPGQRLAYIIMRRRAGLPIKYTRNSDPMSQRLGPSWTTEHLGETDAVVGTRVTYARWVQSAAFQYPMHKATGWVTDAEAIEQLKRDNVIEPIVRDALEKALNVGVG